MLWPTQLRICKLRWANMGANSGPVRQAFDGAARVENGARPDVLRPLIKVRKASFDEVCLEDVGAAMQIAHRFPIARTSDIMAADDELVGLVQVETSKQRQA